jgi:2-polyprenyl-6-methoxyphenol hydroxylase-like FAD-dependent oxidoreductase
MAQIIVIGGSLGGLLVANMLLRAGHHVQILEKSNSSLDGRGAGIVTHQPLITALGRCGIALDASLGVAIQERVVLGHDGQEIAIATLPQVLTSWSRLYAILLSAFDKRHYIHGVTVSHVTQQEDSASVHCEGGEIFKADVVLASDGIRSTVREQMLPDAQAQYAGYVAWRGVCDEQVLSQRTLSSMFGKFGFGLPHGEQIIGYPVAGAGNAIAAGQRSYNFVWYRPASSAQLKELMTDSDGHFYALGIPPHKVAWRHVAAARQAAREILAPQFAEILEKTAQPFLQPIYDCTSSQLAFGRLALMGDAAFVARPHVGMGVTKAAQDAMALTDSITVHGAGPQALANYEALRLAAGLAVVQRARALGAYMQAQTQVSGVPPIFTRDARSVMLETAIDLSHQSSSTQVQFSH